MAEAGAIERVRHTRWFLIVFYSLAIIWGVRCIYIWLPSALDMMVKVMLQISLAGWAVVDAQRRRRPMITSARPWVLWLAYLVVPVYVVWSRKWTGLGWVVLHFASWYFLASIVAIVGGFTVFGMEWINALEF